MPPMLLINQLWHILNKCQSQYKLHQISYIKVCLNNTSDSSYQVKKGDRIAQILIQRNEPFTIEECEDLSNTDRGSGGFGSSGK